MRFNSYHQAIVVLRNREVEPSFEDIRTLVLSQKPSRKVLPFWLYISSSISLLVAFFIVFFPELFNFITGNAIPNRFIPSHKLSTSAYSLSPNQGSINGIRHRFLVTQNNGGAVPNFISFLPDEKLPVASIASPEHDDTSSAIERSQPPAANHPPPIGSQTSVITEMQSPQIRFSFFVSAGMFPRSGQSFLNLISSSIGTQVYLNNSSSLVLELRRNSFIQQTTANTIHFRDSIINNGGSISHDTIRWITSVQRESPNNFLSVNAGYRLNFPELHSFSAFIEALAGISAQGGLASELAGLQYSFNSPISLAITLRSDQLFSRRNSPQATLDIGVSMSFIW